MPSSKVSEPSYLSPRQAAIDAGVSVRTIRRAIAARKLVAYRVGRQVRIARSDLVQFVERHPV